MTGGDEKSGFGCFSQAFGIWYIIFSMRGMGKKIIFMGAVGSGKSTQADLLTKKLNLPRVNMGEIFRRIAQDNQEVKEIVLRGELVNDEITMLLLRQELGDEKYNNGFVIDGVPRNLFQAENLPFEPDVIIYLSVRDSENIKRLTKRGRTDDTKDVIKNRLVLYHEQTEPVLDFYRGKGKLVEVDGEPPIEVIFKDILQKLKVLN